MGMISSQPFEVRDFTGGLTDKFIQGQPNQYMQADNFILTTDGKLATRPGSVIIDSVNYRLPDTAHGKVDFMGGWITQDLLLAQSSTALYVMNTNWVELLGPTSNKAFPSHDADSRISTGEWNRHFYMTPDSGTFPLKLYKDFSGSLRLRTAGLPQPVVANTLTDAAYLTAANALANELKSKIIAHLSDYNNGVLVTWAHTTHDVVSAALINAAAAATDFISLQTLTIALKAGYDSHLTDAQLVGGSQVYHVGAKAAPVNAFLGILPVLNYLSSAALGNTTTLAGCVAILNDLRNRFNWHTWSTATHVNAYNISQVGYGAHATSFTEVHNTAAPTFSGQDQIVFNYVNNLKFEFNTHLADETIAHSSADSLNVIRIPDATDLWGVVAILSHLEYFYWKHYEDANYLVDNGATQVYYLVDCTFTAGLPQITAMTVDPNTFISVSAAFPSYYIRRHTSTGATNPYNWVIGSLFPTTKAHAVSIDSVSQITMSQNATTSISLGTIFSQAQYHFDIDRNTEAFTTPSVAVTNASALDLTLVNLQNYIDAAQVLANKIKAHEVSGGVATAGTDTTIPAYIQYFPPPTFTGTQYLPHQITAAGFLFPAINVTVGLHYFETPPVQIQYLYVLCWRYDYQVDSGTQFENISTPSAEYAIFSTVSPAGAIPLDQQALYPIQLDNLPVLVNDASTNYDTAAIILDVYKTIGNGSTFYLATSVLNGITSAQDASVDSLLVSGQQLYTTGGVSFNDQPPISKFMTILNTTGYFANVVDTGQSLTNRVRQSNGNAIDSCPATFFDDLDEEITGMNSVRNNVVVFSNDSVYRMEGLFNLLGQGLLTHERISSTIGSFNNAGVVKTENGLFFPGNDGFYFTDGFQITKISSLFDSYYAAFTKTPLQRSRIYGTYDKLKKRILWSVQLAPWGSACDSLYVLHLNYGVKANSVFTTWSNGTHFKPTSILFFEGTLYRGDERGYVFKHDDLVKTDPKINTAVAATSWQVVYMPWAYASCAVDFGTTFTRKWVPKMGITGLNVGNADIQIQSENDNGKNYYLLTPVTYTVNPMWGQPDIIWQGTELYPWKYDGQLDQWRRFAAGSLRCQFKQITLTPSHSVIYASEHYGNALCTVAAGPKTATLLTPSGFTSFLWPLDVVDYVMAFETDGYVNEFTVTALDVTSKIITFSDATNLVSSGTFNWVIRGKRKEAAISLTSYVIHWAPLGESLQAGFHGATDTGENT